MGGSNQKISNTAPVISSLRLQTSTFGRAIARVYGRTRVSANLIWYGDFTPIAHTTTQSSGGKGGGGVTTIDTTYTYTAAVLLALCSGQIGGVVNVWRSKAQYALADLGLSLFDGSPSQAPFGYLTSNHPAEALSYRGLAYVASGAYEVGESAALPNHSFEIDGLLPFSGSIKDSNPKDVIVDALTNPLEGMLFPAANIGDLTALSNYCVANGIFISPAYTEQRQASEVLEALAQIANAGIFWSEGLLKIRPYSDEAKTGNGATYTPDVTPVYALTDDDFLDTGEEDPVQVSRSDPADANNQVSLKYVNRANEYNDETVEAKDQADIELLGLRPMDEAVEMREIVDAAVARVVVQNILQRKLYLRNTYSFPLPWNFALLEPMDIVTLTEGSGDGLDNVPVRIVAIEENDDGGLDVEAEDFPAGVSAAVAYPMQQGGGYAADYNAAPGDVNPPHIFDAPGILTVTGFEVWAALSGGPDWGGCQVWVSEDDTTFKQTGTLFGKSRHGQLSAILPVGADPDTVNTLAVDFTVSEGELLAGSQDDVDRLNTLMVVGRELLAYRDATLTAPNEYDLDYLRRGAYNSEIAEHASAAKIARLDQALFRYYYDAPKLGSTIYLKFLSFNVYGIALQELADVSSYPYTIAGSTSYPSNVNGFSANQNDIVVLFQWEFVDEPNVEGYEIRRNELGNENWDDGEPVTQVTRGTQITTAKVPPGDWTFLMCARDTSKNYSRTPARKDLTVTNAADIVQQVQQAPLWPGTKTGFLVHHTGKLVFESTLAANAHTNAELFEQFVPYPVASASYEAPEIDAGVDGTVRIWGAVVTAYRPDKPGTAIPELEIDYHLAAGAYDGFQPWSIGTVDTRFVKERFTINSALGTPVVTSFLPTLDAEEHSESQSGLAIGAGGTFVPFLTTYFGAPDVTFENDSATPLHPTVTGLTSAGFTGHLYNTSGTQVGGTGKYRATGV